MHKSADRFRELGQEHLACHLSALASVLEEQAKSLMMPKEKGSAPVHLVGGVLERFIPRQGAPR